MEHRTVDAGTAQMGNSHARSVPRQKPSTRQLSSVPALIIATLVVVYAAGIVSGLGVAAWRYTRACHSVTWSEDEGFRDA